MKLLAIAGDGAYRLGAMLDDRRIVDVKAALGVHPEDGIAAEPMAFIRSGTAGRKALERYLERLREEECSAFAIEESAVDWGPCVPAPGKIICTGLNYRKHADESKLPYPKVPLLFNKFNNALAAHGDDIRLPEGSNEVDYEAELGIVIGSRAANVDVSSALGCVFGYCAVNDVSARDWQMRTSQWMLGKTFDGFCPAGPYLVTADEIGDPQQLQIMTRVNGELRQHSSTRDMIFTCAEIISYISRHMTLEPGDLILTGTPEGVAFGMPLEQRAYLRPGDVVTVEIEGLGALTNRFV
ncbi:fumarylacetoacetate hydrolase family protein [Paenibacillus cisolokensis]|uniref:fumarylacetoacetate hydrolase family protein n=1 Tax=Paenibacillus cisolokensis TaxID=1658519 RepID=UPI003D2794C2